jgi:predicted NBD/HSP70 family sugar kinase
MVITPSYIFKNFHRKPIDKIINKYIKLPVYCANDARCALLGEQMFGALKNYHQDSVMLVIGTGIGTALFIDNKIYDGMSHSAGEGGLLFSNETNYKLQSNTFNLINNAKKIKNTIFKGEQVLKLAKTNPLLKNIVNQ